MIRLKSLFKTRSKPSSDIPLPACAPEQVVQIIGDIHGSLRVLQELCHRLDPACQVITVGDYIDRGDQSAEVLSFLKEKNTNQTQNWVCLRGNHEQMMIDFLDDPARAGNRWLRNGGLQTLASFGIGGITEFSKPAALQQARDELKAAMPAGQQDWLRQLPLTWSSGNLWVVHAAADPELPMNEQTTDTLTWGHRKFMTQPRTDGIWVAHGHTIVDTPENTGARIAVDTGAYFSGVLTAARCAPDGSVTFIQS